MQITSKYSTLVNPPELAITWKPSSSATLFLGNLCWFCPGPRRFKERKVERKRTEREREREKLYFELCFLVKSSAQKDCWWLNKTDNLFQSHASMLGDTTAAPTASTATVNSTVFTQPWPLDSLPNTALEYLSASLNNPWRVTSTPSLNTFSFWKLRQLK